MKELSTEEKAKRYDEALKAAVVARKDEDKHLKATLERIFPELKESEDERIRKALICHISKISTEIPIGALHRINGVDIPDILAWLEKQKAVDILDEEEREFADNVDSYRKEVDAAYQKGYNEGVKATLEKQGEQKPTDKSESVVNILNKETQQVQQEDLIMKPSLNTESTWSEEDENEVAILEAYIRSGEWSESHIGRALGIVDELVNKCKSLKDRVGCEANCTTIKEWNVEDISKVQRICRYLDGSKKYYADITEIRECIDWLKSLRPQKQWKPSEKQMEALEQFISEYKDIDDNFRAYPISHNIESLYNDLKKLTE